MPWPILPPRRRLLLILLVVFWVTGVFIIHVKRPIEKPYISETPSLRDKRTPPGKSPLPPMGWNSWNALGCNTTEINEEKLKSMMDILVDSGLGAAGYKYFVIDDCWLDPGMTRRVSRYVEMFQQYSRTVDAAFRIGSLRADPSRFTNGSLASLSSYAHERGLWFGSYLDAGIATCQGYAGSYGHEKKDVNVFAEWNVDFLKLDGCAMGGTDAAALYTKWSDLLTQTGRNIVFSCSYPAYDEAIGNGFPDNFDWERIQRICNLWRLYSDVYADWKSLVAIMDYWSLHENVLRKYHRENGFNDPDMLELGNGITLEEGKTQMSIWSILAAPLILGNDLTKMTREELAALANDEVIAVNQDPLVVQGRRVINATDHSIWIRVLYDQSVAIAAVNLQASAKSIGCCWKDIVNDLEGISLSSLMSDNCIVRARDLWKRKDVGGQGHQIQPKTSPCLFSIIPSHGTYLIRLWFNASCFKSPR